MQFAAALIEYLITGIVASIWMATLINKYINLPLGEIKEYKEIFVVVYFPVAYILGIYIDVTSSFLIRRTKELYEPISKTRIFSPVHKAIAWVISKIVGNPKEDSYERSAEILTYSTGDLVRTMEAYVSRDRIARGMALNSLFGGLVSAFFIPDDLRAPVSIACFISFVVSVLVWIRLRRLSSRFKRVAISKLSTLKNKIAGSHEG